MGFSTVSLASGKLTSEARGGPGVEGMMMLRPQMHLIAAGRLYPKAWRQADQFRADRGKGSLPTWPSWCYLPMAVWYAIVSEGMGPCLLIGSAISALSGQDDRRFDSTGSRRFRSISKTFPTCWQWYGRWSNLEAS